MKKKRFLRVALILLIGCLTVILPAACGGRDERGFTVSFETNGGTTYLPVTTVAEGQAIELAVPEKSGFRFLGWYDSADLSGDPIEGSEYVPTSDITLYAAWSAIQCTVSFVTDGDTQYESVVSGGQPVRLPSPMKKDYDFLGWYTNAAFSGEALGETFTPLADTTLYAKWAPAFAVITFEPNGGTDCAPVRNMRGQTVSLPTPLRYGYEFLGWYDNAALAGEAVSLSEFASGTDVALYASWKKVTYLYLYYGLSADHIRLCYEPGETVNLDDLYKPEDVIIDGIPCGFLKWVFDGLEPEDAPQTVSVGEEHICLVAVYDRSALPPKENIEKNPDGSLTTTAKAIKVLTDEGENEGCYGLDITFEKGKSGSANAAIRMIHSGADYAYEDAATYYLAVGVAPSTGIMQISKVVNGAWSTVRGNIALKDLPASWQNKFGAAAAGEKLTVRLTVCDYGTYFEAYLDGELAYTCTDTALLNSFTGTGFGFRSSTKGAVFSGWDYRPLCVVQFDSKGGSACENLVYAFGKLDAGTPSKQGYVFSGWFYDAACTEAVDLDNPVLTGGGPLTLYAGWIAANFTVTLMSEGKVYGTIGYAGGGLSLPDAKTTAGNKIFTGWYMDENCSVKVNEDVPGITEDVTLYAGWRYPTHSNLTDNGDGTYTVGNGRAAAVLGESAYAYTLFEMNYSFAKSSGGAGGLAFRMALYADNSYEKDSQYISVGLGPDAGVLQVAKIDNGFSQMKGSQVALAKLPQAWQTKFNAAPTASVIHVLLSVRDYGSYFEVYLDGDLAFTSVDDLSAFTGKGYGVRSSTKNVTFDIHAEEIAAPEEKQ